MNRFIEAHVLHKSTDDTLALAQALVRACADAKEEKQKASTDAAVMTLIDKLARKFELAPSRSDRVDEFNRAILDCADRYMAYTNPN